MNASSEVMFIAGWAQTERSLAPLAEVLSDRMFDAESASLISVASLLNELEAAGRCPSDEGPSPYAIALASRLASREQPGIVDRLVDGRNGRAGNGNSLSTAGAAG